MAAAAQKPDINMGSVLSAIAMKLQKKQQEKELQQTIDTKTIDMQANAGKLTFLTPNGDTYVLNPQGLTGNLIVSDPSALLMNKPSSSASTNIKPVIQTEADISNADDLVSVGLCPICQDKISGTVNFTV